MKNFDGIEKRRPTWGKREWLNFARLQTQDLRAALRRSDDAKETIERLRAALEEIAKQKLSSQLIPGDADFEIGYDCCVKTARKALNPDD